MPKPKQPSGPDLLARLDVIRGPYSNNNPESSDFGRQHVRLVYLDGHIRTVSYPKFLVEFLLDRELDKKLETIDHIDGNYLNNAWSNLRILTFSEHMRQDTRRSADATMPCRQCGDPVTRVTRKFREGNKAGKAGPFCSKKCIGRYSAELRKGLIKPLPPQTPVEPQFIHMEKTGGIRVADLPEAQGITEADILAYILATQENKALQRVLAPKPRKPRRRCPCGNKLTKGRKFCSLDCSLTAQTKAQRPSPEELRALVWAKPTVQVAREFGVSDKAIDKWCRVLGVDKPPRGYWRKIQCGKDKAE
ncbi:MAG: HNH endonuclease [Patescibacteria group bacterium]